MEVKQQLAEEINGLLKGTGLELERQALVSLLDMYYITPILTDKAEDLPSQIQRYIRAKQVDGLSDQTLRNYGYILGILSGQLHMDVAQITTDHLREYIRCIAENRGLKPGSLRTHINILRGFFTWLQLEGVIPHNPMLRIKSPSSKKKNIPKALSPAELKKVRKACQTPRERALVEFLVSSGCRVGEASGLQLEDMDFTGRHATVTGKGSKTRTVYFTQQAKELIEHYLSQRKGGNDALFAGARAPYGPLQARTIQEITRKIGKRANLPFALHPHLFRHTFATDALNKGMRLDMIQTLLGHEDMGTTRIYATMSNKLLQKEFKRYVG